MGFGSYDESERRNQEREEDESAEGVSLEENEHEGEVSFESDESAEDLIDRLQEIKEE
ncbi:death domain-associated protein [Halobacteriales archaeon SW_5_70_135]|nr:MAG: death domain-associated protein [Halobacteriales archaeon SW_5_70_135]